MMRETKNRFHLLRDSGKINSEWPYELKYGGDHQHALFKTRAAPEKKRVRNPFLYIVDERIGETDPCALSHPKLWNSEPIEG